MRKMLLIVAFAMFCTGLLFSQGTKPCERPASSSALVRITDDIGDFTVTDSDGVTLSLYDALDAGKTVFIDLFFST